MKNLKKIKFGELYAIPSRNGLSRPERVRGTGYKMINMGEIFEFDRIGNIPMELVPMSPREINDMCVEEDDLLFARQSLVLSGAGKVSIITKVQEKTTFESHIIRVRLDKAKAEPLFYYYYFKSPYSGMRSIVQQCAQSGIRGSDLRKLVVNYPDPEDQKTIAYFINAYDQLIDKNHKRIQLLEESARLLFREWFVYFRFPGYEKVKIIDGVPEGWKKENIFSIADVNYGKNLPINKFTEEGEYPVYGAAKIIGKFNKYTKEKRTIIAGCRGSVGQVTITRPKSYITNNSFTFEPKNLEIFYWLYFSLDVRGFSDVISGTAQPQITLSSLCKIKLLFPNKKVIKDFELKVASYFDLLFTLEDQNQKLAQARDLLLPRLMSGAIKV